MNNDDFGSCVGATVLLVGGFLFMMAVVALQFTAGVYVFMDGGLWDGWHAAWDRPVWLFLFALCEIIFGGSMRKT